MRSFLQRSLPRFWSVFTFFLFVRLATLALPLGSVVAFALSALLFWAFNVRGILLGAELAGRQALSPREVHGMITAVSVATFTDPEIVGRLRATPTASLGTLALASLWLGFCLLIWQKSLRSSMDRKWSGALLRGLPLAYRPEFATKWVIPSLAGIALAVLVWYFPPLAWLALPFALAVPSLLPPLVVGALASLFLNGHTIDVLPFRVSAAPLLEQINAHPLRLGALINTVMFGVLLIASLVIACKLTLDLLRGLLRGTFTLANRPEQMQWKLILCLGLGLVTVVTLPSEAYALPHAMPLLRLVFWTWIGSLLQMHAVGVRGGWALRALCWVQVFANLY